MNKKSCQYLFGQIWKSVKIACAVKGALSKLDYQMLLNALLEGCDAVSLISLRTRDDGEGDGTGIGCQVGDGRNGNGDGWRDGVDS